MTMGLVHAARQIEQQGRGPDKSLAHISPDESAMLDYMQGGRRTNPVTGLAEYSLFGKILKAVAKIGASTVGFMYGGPLGAAAASAAVSKLTGDSWKGALTTGAISGLTAGLGSYAAGTRGLGNIATTTGNEIVGKAAAAGAIATPEIETVGYGAATPAVEVPAAIPEIETAGYGAAVAPAAAPAAVSAPVTGLASAAKANPLTVSGSAMEAATKGAGSTFNPTFMQTIQNAGTFARMNPVTAIGMATPPIMESFQDSGGGLPPPAPTTPLDPSNVFPWLNPAYGADAKTRRLMASLASNLQNFTPTDIYQNNMQGYADGGTAAADGSAPGIGLPPSAAVPQLMSAAQWGYLNARTGGQIHGPGDGKSDDIPAMLSNGEHVIDAATVSDLGNGDNDIGQQRIEKIKQKIRSSAGRKNPNKASPKQKGFGSLLKSAQA